MAPSPYAADEGEDDRKGHDVAKEPHEDSDLNFGDARLSKTPSSTGRSHVSTTVQVLCEKCSALNISQDGFIITDPVLKYDSLRHQRPTTLQPLPSTKTRLAVPLRSGAEDVRVGTLQEIQERVEFCGLCALIDRSVRAYSRSPVAEHLTTCSLRWELDGRESASSSTHQHAGRYAFTNRTRRLRLLWRTNEASPREAFFVFVARTYSWRPNSDASTSLSRGRHFLGREVEQWKGKQALIKSWLDLCTHNHGDICETKVTQSREFERLLEGTYFGVIDVVDMQLKPLPKDAEGRPAHYAALSYVWGRRERPYTTVRSNVLLHRRHGGLELGLKQLPTTMLDAINVVQKLGLRYIWIDALCIVQDSPISFRLNASVMHTIYGNAYMTICAADGVDAWEGLRAMHEPISDEVTAQLSAEILPGVRLQVSRPPEMVIRDSKWNTRAWTFQERFLSRRCVVFAEGRVYFQCRRSAMSEDIHNEATGSSWSFQSMGAPLRYFVQMENRSLSFYMTSVSQFYQRDLTRSCDILAAYAGIETVLKKVMRAPFYFGLPSSHLDLALLWQPLKAGRRRKPIITEHQHEGEDLRGSSYAHNRADQDDALLNDDFDGHEFPSWSWSGWIGGSVEYLPNALEGPLLDVQEWLREHTWIRYYIRDGRGRLRPLWDRGSVEEDVSRERRWRGYAGIRVGNDETAPVHPRSAQLIIRSFHGEHEEDKRNPVRFLRKPSEPRDRVRDSRENGYREEIYPSYTVDEEPVRYDEGLGEEETSSAEVPEGAETNPPYSDRENVMGRPSPREEVDYWGRTSRNAFSSGELCKDDFSMSLPESPFGVKEAPFTTRPPANFPDMPILQFWTMRTSLQVVIASSDPESGLSQCHVGDHARDWCGTVLLSTDWIKSREGASFDFIALSRAKAFTEQEHPVWTYYVATERTDSAWDIYYALLVERDNVKCVWERVGLGKIFRNAFTYGEWDEIVLG